MASVGGASFIFTIVNLILMAVSIIIVVLLVYALILSIKALKVYIEKNSSQ